MSKIVTVQDISCFGQCSITVALPVLSAFGIETAILPSAILSTHTGGFKNFTVLDLTDEMPKIIRHWKEEGLTFDSIYTGYIGDARQFDMIKGMRDMLVPGGQLIVDPAMADFGRLYSALDENIVDGFRSLLKDADVIMPNLTEAAFLLGDTYKESLTEEEVKSIVMRLADMGPDTVILTGVSYEPDKIGAVAYQKQSGTFESYFTKRIAKTYHGTGDVFSSVVVADIVNGADLKKTLKDACEFVVKAIEYTLPDETHMYGVRFEQVLQDMGRRDCAEVYRKELVRTTLAPDEVNDEAYYNRAWNLEVEGQFTRL